MNIELETLIEVIADALEVPAGELTANSTSEDLQQWDSLAHLRVCMAIEERYGVSIEMERIPELDSVSKLATYLRG